MRRVRALLGVDARRRRSPSALRRQRQRQNGVLLAALVVLHAVLWFVSSSWWVRGSAVVLTVLAWPVLTVLAFDRRAAR